MLSSNKDDFVRIAELFAGIGGVTGGFLDAGGFDPVCLIDSDLSAAHVFKKNFQEYADRYHTRSIGQRLTGERFLDLAGGRVDGILGCPPCQGFSAAGLRDPNDERNDLLDEMRRIIKTAKPLFFVLENVPSLLGSSHFERFCAILRKDYMIHAEVLNAAEYGIPQIRRRMVALGILRKAEVVPTFPRPTHGGCGRVFDYCSGRYLKPSSPAGCRAFQLRSHVQFPKRPLVALEDALSDLPREVPRHDGTPGGQAFPIAYVDAPSTPYQRRMRITCKHVKTVTHHLAWRHQAGLVNRMRRTAAGDCPEDSGNRSRNLRYFSQAYARLHPRGLARTITTSFHNPGSGRFTHYDAPRSLTLREALRLQSFGDDFSMSGIHLTEAERLVGNAFPRRLAEIIGRHIVLLLGTSF
jgi:DNA-cytosine methyltransferase